MNIRIPNAFVTYPELSTILLRRIVRYPGGSMCDNPIGTIIDIPTEKEFNSLVSWLNGLGLEEQK